MEARRNPIPAVSRARALSSAPGLHGAHDGNTGAPGPATTHPPRRGRSSDTLGPPGQRHRTWKRSTETEAGRSGARSPAASSPPGLLPRPKVGAGPAAPESTTGGAQGSRPHLPEDTSGAQDIAASDTRARTGARRKRGAEGHGHARLRESGCSAGCSAGGTGTPPSSPPPAPPALPTRRHPVRHLRTRGTEPRPPLLHVQRLGCPDQTLCPFQLPPQKLPTSATPLSRKVSNARPSPYPAALREEGVCSLTTAPCSSQGDSLVQPVLRRRSGLSLPPPWGLLSPLCCLPNTTPTSSFPTRTLSLCCYSPTWTQLPVPGRGTALTASTIPGTATDPSPRGPTSLGDNLLSRLALNPLHTFTGTWVVPTPSFQACAPATCCRVPHSHVVGSTKVTTSKWPALSLTEQDCRRASPAIGDQGPGTGLSRTACLCSADLRGHSCSLSPAGSF